jgi:hypothetical protein
MKRGDYGRSPRLLQGSGISVPSHSVWEEELRLLQGSGISVPSHSVWEEELQS